MSTLSPILGPRRTEDKLFRFCLVSCIDQLERLTISKRRAGGPGECSRAPSPVLMSSPLSCLPVLLTNASASSNRDPDRDDNDNDNSTAARTLSLPCSPQPSTKTSENAITLPTLTPQHRTGSLAGTYPCSFPILPHCSRSPQLIVPTMHRLSYSGDPSRGPAYGNQDARSNLAVQPAATTMKINLKKAAIKVVGPASGVGLPPSKPPQPAAAQMEPKKVDA